MEILIRIKKVLKFSGFIVIDSGKTVNIIIRFICICALLLNSITAIWYFTYDAINFLDYAMSFTIILITSYVLSLYISLMLRNNMILTAIEKLQQSVEERHGQTTSPIYTEANDFIENILMKSILIPWILAMTPAVICPAMAKSYYKYYIQHSGPMSFQLPFPITVPYNWRTPTTYFLTMLVQTVQYLISYTTHVNAVATFIAICKIIETFCIDFGQELNDLEKVLIEFNDGIKYSLAVVRMDVKTRLKRLIQFHCDLKRRTNECNAAFHLVLGVCLFFTIMALIMFLFETHICIKTSDLTTLIMLASCATANLPFAYWLCEVGESLTASFVDLDNCIYDTSWYQCPADIQHYLRLMIVASQPEIYFDGFFSMHYSRDAFKQIINAGYTYFMMLQRMNV